MKRSIPALLAVLALAASPAMAGLGVGDRAPMPEAKESLNLADYAPKNLEGRVVLYEVFRTW